MSCDLRRSKVVPVLFILCVSAALSLATIALSATAVASASLPQDDFDDGIVNQALWRPAVKAGADPGTFLTEEDGRLVLTLTPSPLPEDMYVSLGSRWYLRGRSISRSTMNSLNGLSITGGP